MKILIVGSVNGAVKKLVEIVEKIQDKKGEFQLLLCCGNFLPQDYQKLEEFHDHVLKGVVPIPTYFIDSTNFISPFMTKNLFKFNKNLHFLGRSGIFEFQNLRIAYVSGQDSEILGPEINSKMDPEKEYMSNYFCRKDIQKMMSEKPVDIMITCQYPIGVFNLPSDSLSLTSSSQGVLAHLLCPRYLYCSTSESLDLVPDPFINRLGWLTRPHILNSLQNGVYIKAIEIEPQQFQIENGEKTTFLEGEEDLFEGAMRVKNQMIEKYLENKKTEQKIVTKSKSIFVQGFDRRRSDIEDLHQYFTNKYGNVVDIYQPKDKNGRRQPYIFIEFERIDQAEKAVSDSGRANFQGARLTINYKIQQQTTRAPLEDKDCWFCFCNPKIEKHLIFHETENFYCALPKGPVSDQHFLIVTKMHIGCVSDIFKDQKLSEEYLNLKQKITEHLGSYFIYERFIPYKFEKAVHFNLQIFGIKQPNIDERIEKLSKVFLQNSSNKGLKKQKIESFSIISNESEIPPGPYFYMEATGMETTKGRKVTKYVIPIQESQQFDFQFGRMLACHILDQKQKLSWKDCLLPFNEQKDLADKYRTLFN